MRDTNPIQSPHTIPWDYRVAQNPRFVWAPPAMINVGVALLATYQYFNGSDSGDVHLLLFSAAFLGMSALCLNVGGFTHITAPRLIDGPVKRVPATAPWIMTIPFFATLLGLGVGCLFAVRKFWDSFDTSGTLALYIMAVMSFILIATAVFVFSIAGFRRGLVFSPDALEYTRGRFYARIPWDSVVELVPVCDANSSTGGAGRRDKASGLNLRAGVQLIVHENVETRRRTMLFRVNGRDAINVDCSGYKIDPNTLINTIYVLVEFPELRPLLTTSEGAALFLGPDWSTRRRMRVGDVWERRTGEIVSDMSTAEGVLP